MSQISSNTSFFAFGPDESYVSKSAEGLRFRELPTALHQLIVAGSVVDAYWAALGPPKESWVLAFKDREGMHKLGWGAEIPWELEELLKDVTPTSHFRVFLGPRDSFIAWGPGFIRWVGLPSGLEACLQGWLTPAGWKAGPPRIMTWGRKGAYFALSDYGEVKYRLGSGGAWPIFKETVEEWDAEAGFSWGDLAYIALDPTTTDRFVAIRDDKIWAGSIDDNSEGALESFALNFFSRAKSKPKPRSQESRRSEANGNPNRSDTVPEIVAQAVYEQWATEVASAFASALAANGGKVKAPKKLQIRNQTPKVLVPPTTNEESKAKKLSRFPYIPPAVASCRSETCTASKADPSGLRACEHDVERLFRASGRYSYEWLRQERVRWHPDRFGRLCEDDWRETGMKLAEEMFKIIDRLMTDLERAAATDNGV